MVIDNQIVCHRAIVPDIEICKLNLDVQPSLGLESPAAVELREPRVGDRLGIFEHAIGLRATVHGP